MSSGHESGRAAPQDVGILCLPVSASNHHHRGGQATGSDVGKVDWQAGKWRCHQGEEQVPATTPTIY